MKKIVTNVSLMAVGGEPSVVWGGFSLHSRELCTDGLDETEFRAAPSLVAAPEHLIAYELFPNLNSPVKLLKACEEFSRPPIVEALCADVRETELPVSDAVNPLALLASFGIENPKRTALDNAKEVIQKWCHPSDVSAAIPVKDILAMSRDLRALITMLLFTIGNACTPEMLARNATSGLALLDAEALGYRCYERYIEAIPPYLLPGGVEEVRQEFTARILPMIESAPATEALDSPSTEAMREFCNLLISALMHPLSPVLSLNGFFAVGEHASLGGAYAFWANEAINGKAGVCEHCGNIFVRERKNKRFCSPACKVAAHNKGKALTNPAR